MTVEILNYSGHLALELFEWTGFEVLAGASAVNSLTCSDYSRNKLGLYVGTYRYGVLRLY